jgi:heat shock protein HslJ
MKHRARITVLLATALLASACSGGTGSGTPSASGSPPDGTGPQGLDGRTFLSTGIEGRVLVAGSRIRISFHDGQVSVSGGCNSMSGPYLLDGNRLVARRMATTEMACEEPLMAQDTWLADLLDGATITLDGTTLTLSKGGVTLTLEDREVADPDRPLLGTRWVVDGLVSGEAVSSVPLGVTAALTFSDGRVGVEAGCNNGGGTVDITATTLGFGPIALTKMACGGPAMAVEQAVLAVLNGTAPYEIEADVLTIRAGERGLMLRATP